ncbi:MAG: SAM hydrolase/SAM-dependent halogenase family protein [Candidatus Asgardarchaeia archaeon]
MTRKVITLLTDFGLRDNYVAIMKGVILNICSNDVTLIDITHEVTKFDVLDGAFLLLTSFNYFPKATVHLVVIDPGVGTHRAPIAIKTKNYFFVGPDNGVLVPAAKSDGILEVRIIENSDFYLQNAVSYTFHGRDIFAPVAAHLACNENIFFRIGRKISIDKLIKPKISDPVVDKNKIYGSVFHIDSFGNIITNIPSSLLSDFKKLYGSQILVKINKKTVKLPFVKSFGHVKEGNLLSLIDSYNLFEISLNKGNAAKKLNAKVGDSVTIILGDS